MAFPAALAPFVLPALFTGGSMALNKIAANKQQKEFNRINRAEDERREKLQAEAMQLNEDARAQYENFNKSQDAKTESLGDLFRDVAVSKPVESAVVAPPSSSNVVNNATASARDETASKVSRRADAIANLRGVSDLFGDYMTTQMRNRGRLGMLNGFQRGSAGVLPMELQAAQRAGAGASVVADLFNLGAGVSLNKALMTPKAEG